MWDLLNSNAGGIQALSSVAAVLVSGITLCFVIAYTSYTKKLLKQSQTQTEKSAEQVAEAHKQNEALAAQREAEARPVIAIFFKTKILADGGQITKVVLRNEGPGVALKIIYSHAHDGTKVEPVAMGPLGPGRSRETNLRFNYALSFGVRAIYQDVAGNGFESVYDPLADQPHQWRPMAKERTEALSQIKALP